MAAWPRLKPGLTSYLGKGPLEIGLWSHAGRRTLARTSMVCMSEPDGGTNDHHRYPHPARSRDRLLPGPSSRLLADRLCAAADRSQITWLPARAGALPCGPGKHLG